MGDFFNVVIAIIAFLVGLTLIISLHELGHFIFAKKSNILCYEYAIGMGPLIYGKKKGETLYAVRCIPLGGYVSMADGAMGAELLKIDREVGINVDENNVVTEIVFDDTKKVKYIGNVVDRDIDAMNGEETLFIELNINGENKRFDVSKEAVLIEKKNKIQVAPYDRTFDSKSLWKRFITLFAGPGMNFVLAFVLYTIVGFSLGKTVSKPIVGSISEGISINNEEYVSPSYAAGLRKGDTIKAINGINVNSWNEANDVMATLAENETYDITYFSTLTNTDVTKEIRPIVYIGNMGVIGNIEELRYDNEGNLIKGARVYVYTTKAEKAGLNQLDIITKIDDTAIESWSDLIKFCCVDNQEEVSKGKNVKIELLRDGETKTIESFHLLSKKTVDGIRDLDYLRRSIGVSAKTKFDFGYSISNGFRGIGKSVRDVWNTLGLLFTSKDVGIKDLSGPVGIYSLVKNSLVGGFFNYLAFLGFLSVNIGIINLLPIPALDGGRIVFLGYEAVTRKKVNKKAENLITNIVFFLLLGLIIYITFNDVLRLF